MGKRAETRCQHESTCEGGSFSCQTFHHATANIDLFRETGRTPVEGKAIGDLLPYCPYRGGCFDRGRRRKRHCSAARV